MQSSKLAPVQVVPSIGRARLLNQDTTRPTGLPVARRGRYPRGSRRCRLSRHSATPVGNVMGDPTDRLEPPRSSRQRYRAFVQDYKHRRLDDLTDADKDQPSPADAATAEA